MQGDEPVRYHTVLQAARSLALHPFEVARILGLVDRLPPDLTLDAVTMERLRRAAGIDTWWRSGELPVQDEPRSRSLVRSLAWHLVERGIQEPRTTRVDNLFRGLPSDEAEILRAAVNHLIRLGWLRSTWNRRGFQVSVVGDRVDDLRKLADGGVMPPIIEAICA